VHCASCRGAELVERFSRGGFAGAEVLQRLAMLVQV